MESPSARPTASTQAARKSRLPRCQVDSCAQPLSDTPSKYFKKFRVCVTCANMPALLINEQLVRFCQQCGRFHPVTEFDGERRSCRDSLALHNARRRKSRKDASTGARQRTAMGAEAATMAAAVGREALSLAVCEAAPATPPEILPTTGKAELSNAAAGSEGLGGEELLTPLSSLVDGQAELLPDAATWDMLCEPLDEDFFLDASGRNGSDTSPGSLAVGGAALHLPGPIELPLQHMAVPVPCEWEQPHAGEESKHAPQQQQQQQALQELQEQQQGQQVHPVQHQHGAQLQEQVLEWQYQQQQYQQQQQEQELHKQLQLGWPSAQQPSLLPPSPFSFISLASAAARNWQLFCSTPFKPGHEQPRLDRSIESQAVRAGSADETARRLGCLPVAAQALSDKERDIACAAPGWVPVAPAPLEAVAPSPTQQPSLSSWPAGAGQPVLRAPPAEGPAAVAAAAALPVLLRSTSLCSRMEVDLSSLRALPGYEAPLRQLRSAPLPATWSPPMADMERLSQSLFRTPFGDLAPHLQEDVLPCMAADKAFVDDLVSLSENRHD